MTIHVLQIFHDFPGKKIFPGFFMTFHNCGNPAKPERQSSKSYR